MEEIKTTRPEWFIINNANSDTCILAIPGRGQTGQNISEWYNIPIFKNTLIIGITPENLEWYPPPHSPTHQYNAVAGLAPAVAAIERIILEIEEYFSISRNKIALVGYSAGGVMALQVGAKHQDFAGIVVHAGAILEPDNLPICHSSMPICLIHCMNDDVFSWEERYLPMQHALSKNNYNLTTIEREYRDGSGHQVTGDDILLSSKFLTRAFGIDYPVYAYNLALAAIKTQLLNFERMLL